MPKTKTITRQIHSPSHAIEVRFGEAYRAANAALSAQVDALTAMVRSKDHEIEATRKSLAAFKLAYDKSQRMGPEWSLSETVLPEGEYERIQQETQNSFTGRREPPINSVKWLDLSDRTLLNAGRKLGISERKLKLYALGFQFIVEVCIDEYGLTAEEVQQLGQNEVIDESN